MKDLTYDETAKLQHALKVCYTFEKIKRDKILFPLWKKLVKQRRIRINEILKIKL